MSDSIQATIDRRVRLIVFLIAASTCFLASEASGQLIHTSTPFQSNGSSYYEYHGVNFGFSLPGGRGPGSRVVGYNQFGQITPNINFGQGSANSAIPAFGGYNPAAANTFGFRRIGGNGGGFSLGLTLAKGSNQQSVTTAPSLTTQNGFGGSFSSGSIRPFVTSVIPVLGHNGAPTVPMARPTASPVYNGVTRAVATGQLRLGEGQQERPQPVRPANYSDPQSSAVSGAPSVNSIRAERQRRLKLNNETVEKLLAEADALVKKRQMVDARIKYREALAETDDKSTKSRINGLIKQTRLKR